MSVPAVDRERRNVGDESLVVGFSLDGKSFVRPSAASQQTVPCTHSIPHCGLSVSYPKSITLMYSPALWRFQDRRVARWDDAAQVAGLEQRSATSACVEQTQQPLGHTRRLGPTHLPSALRSMSRAGESAHARRA